MITEVLQKIKRVDKLLVENANEINATINSNYYKNFSNEAERAKDVEKLNKKMKRLLNVKSNLIDTLMQKCEFEKADISYKQRKLIIPNT